MESNFNNRDFERFVKQNADQYRMFPSENVWTNIHSELHTRRRWYGIGLALLLITTAVVTWVMLVPDNRSEKLASLPSLQIQTALKNSSDKELPVIAVTGPVKITGDRSFINSVENNKQDPFTIYPSAPADYNQAEPNRDIAENEINNAPITSIVSAQPEPTTRTVQNSVRKDNNPVAALKVVSSALPVDGSLAKSDKPVAAPDADNNKRSEEAPDMKLPLIPERIEKAVTKNAAKKKLSWDVYVTPTVSYRSLSENSAYMTAARYNNYVNGTALPYTTDVNTVVNHRPDLGFQVGARAAYPLSKWFSVTGGFQLSVSKYDIKAYDHPAEMTTFALSDRSVSTVSSLRNTNGYKENWLRNFYFAASLPIGMELKLSDGTKNYFGIAGTIQPTYVLDNRAYLISADYKNYAEMPSLTRRWNMNTSFEIFSAHTTGKVQWRVGPQVRYQAMSSFVKNYPIKEHLFDFGLKLGIQLR